MRKAYIQDERIVLQRRKVGSDAFGILFYGLLASVLVQQFILLAPFSQYAAELILLLAASIYVAIGNIVVGNNLFYDSKNGQKTVVINSVVTGIVVAVIVTAFNSINYGLEKMGDAAFIAVIAAITFACGALVSFVAFEFLYLINKKRQKQIDDKYNNSDD